MKEQVRIRPGALDNVPRRELAKFLALYGARLQYTGDGLVITAMDDHEDATNPLDGMEADPEFSGGGEQ